MQALAALQRKILSVVQEYVKPGGTLVYSTCTVTRAENDGNVQWFGEQYPEFQFENMRQLYPGEGRHDGFFIAKWKKQTV